MCYNLCLLTIHVTPPHPCLSNPIRRHLLLPFRSRRGPPSSLYAAPPSAISRDLLNQVLQHVGIPSAHLESANLKIAYKLLCPYGEGVTADSVAPLQEFLIEEFLLRVPADDHIGSRLLYVSMFSEYPIIFNQPIKTMQWSPPVSYAKAKRGPQPPQEQFSCVFAHADTEFRTPMVISDTTTGRVLKDMIRTSCLKHFPVRAQNDDPSLPVIMPDK